jgi:hypothetical protein
MRVVRHTKDDNVKKIIKKEEEEEEEEMETNRLWLIGVTLTEMSWKD